MSRNNIVTASKKSEYSDNLLLFDANDYHKSKSSSRLTTHTSFASQL